MNNDNNIIITESKINKPEVLTEVWAGYEWLFRGNTKEIKVNGESIGYNSKRLNNLLKRIIDKNNESSQYVGFKKKTFTLLSNNYLVPVFTNKSSVTDILKLLKKKKTQNLVTLGFYNAVSNKIYIVLDNKINWLGFTKDDELLNTLYHEMGHYTANNNPSLVRKQYSKNMIRFYYYFFNDYFSYKFRNKTFMSEYARFFYSNAYRLEQYLHKNSNKINIILNKIWLHLLDMKSERKRSSLSDERFNKKLNNLLTFYKGVVQYNSFPMEGYSDIYRSIVMAYKQLGIDLKNDKGMTAFYQELIFPSEILSINLGLDRKSNVSTILASM